jgi:hypothetical protein
MRLWNKNNTPVGGWIFFWKDSSGREFKTVGTSGGFHGLIRKIRREMYENNVTPPEYLEDLVEDQICTRQPPQACYYEGKIGDQLAKTIHVFARAADSVASKIGIQSNLEKKARGCAACGKRRTQMNQLT